MAKHEARSKAEASDEISLPEFDERGFVRRELQATRGTVVAIGLGALLGALSGVGGGAAVWTAGLSPLVLSVLLMYLASVLAVFAARSFFERAGVDKANLDGKAAASYGFWVFATWLTVWVLVLNAV